LRCLLRSIDPGKLRSAAGERDLRARSLITFSTLGRKDAREHAAA
jgi:hypothetical protein